MDGLSQEKNFGPISCPAKSYVISFFWVGRWVGRPAEKNFGHNLCQTKSGIVLFWEGGWVVLRKNFQVKFMSS